MKKKFYKLKITPLNIKRNYGKQMQNQWPYPLFTDLMESSLVLNVTAGTTVPPTDFIPEL